MAPPHHLHRRQQAKRPLTSQQQRQWLRHGLSLEREERNRQLSLACWHCRKVKDTVSGCGLPAQVQECPRITVIQSAPKDHCEPRVLVPLLHTATGQRVTCHPQDIHGAKVIQTLVQRDKIWDFEENKKKKGKKNCFQKLSREDKCYNPAHTFAVVRMRWWAGRQETLLQQSSCLLQL